MRNDIFTDPFCGALQHQIALHHTVYQRIPPRDIFFEDLVAKAFKESGVTDIVLAPIGRSSEDMTVAGRPLSIKSETGIGTDPDKITITKLSTAESTTWESAPLLARIMSHLGKYQTIIMLRAIWKYPPSFHYQLLEIPSSLLAKMDGITVTAVRSREKKMEPTDAEIVLDVVESEKPKKSRRPSLKGYVTENGVNIFEVFFDGGDYKCRIQNLLTSHVRVVAEWDYAVPTEWQDNWPIKPPKEKKVKVVVTNPPYKRRAKKKSNSLTLPGFSEDQPK